jgi:hypothetical protein
MGVAGGVRAPLSCMLLGSCAPILDGCVLVGEAGGVLVDRGSKSPGGIFLGTVCFSRWSSGVACGFRLVCVGAAVESSSAVVFSGVDRARCGRVDIVVVVSWSGACLRGCGQVTVSRCMKEDP